MYLGGISYAKASVLVVSYILPRYLTISRKRFENDSMVR